MTAKDGELKQEREKVSITILPSHPYFKAMKPSVYSLDGGKTWIVKWRDFLMIKHDKEFDNEADARDFAFRLTTTPVEISDEEASCWGNDTIAQCDKGWRELAADVRLSPPG